MKNNAVGAATVASVDPYISKRLNIVKFALYAVMLLATIFAFYTAFRLSMDLLALKLALGVSGLIVAAWALSGMLRKSSEWVYLPTGSVVKKQSLFFDLKHFEELKEFVDTGKQPSLCSMKSEAGGNIRLDVLKSGDRQFVALQLFRFVPYMYKPITEIHPYMEQEAARLASIVSK